MEPSSDVSIDSVDENIQKSSLNRVKKRKKQLYADLKNQMEFYLSDANLRKDRYFGHLMQISQCISVDTFLNCNKIKNLTTNPEDLIKAIESSSVLAVSDCKTKIYRIKPIEDKQPEDIDRCTVYVEQLPSKADHEWVKSMFEKYGNVAYISLPKFKSGIIKRFAFVEFENEESAHKVLEDYNKLHEKPKILPEELQSIITFKEDEEKEEANKGIDENVGNIKLECKQLDKKPKIAQEELQSTIIHKTDKKNEDEVNKDTNEIADSVKLIKKRKHSISNDCVIEKKLKKELTKVSPVGIKNKKKKKKDKHKKSIDNEQKNSSFELSDNETNQRATLNESLDYSIETAEEIMPSEDDKKESSVLLNNDGSIKKKKRKRNKGKKVKSDTDITITGLRIMSKTEWKKLRNTFLNMQRQKMSLLKAHLRRPRYTENSNYNSHEKSQKNDVQKSNIENEQLEKPKSEDIRVKYEPGVILKISFANPIESDKIFKAEAKTDSNVKFVDVVNNFEAYVRCNNQESAKKIAEENRWPQTSQLKGEEEKLYWEKIVRDREIKCTKQKGTKKLRGRLKLINKAEKKLAQHFKFTEENE